MSLLVEFLFETCTLGFYYGVGRCIYGPDFIKQNRKQPMHRRIIVSLAVAFLIVLIIALFRLILG